MTSQEEALDNLKVDQIPVLLVHEGQDLLGETGAERSPTAHWTCVHEDGWKCYALPTTAMDDVHPGLGTPGATDRSAPSAPTIFSVTTAPGALAVEWHWGAATDAQPRGLGGAWVELLRLGPGQVAERRGLLVELSFGRLARARDDKRPQARALSADCLQVLPLGKHPRHLVAPGRYCVGAGGRLLAKP